MPGSDATLAQRFASASFQEVCASLSLSLHEDGYFSVDLPDASPPSALFCLPVGEIFPWQRIEQDVEWSWLAGAPLALTTSPDGHDAAASHLGPAQQHNMASQLTVLSDHWHTSESLGQWSLVQVSGPRARQDVCSTKAAPDWFPRPRQL
ncbi:cupin domain-containing protein [Alphaproteobacteria bacterium]|nr:cupin domain-containing protein [Alphaproteobacteria bacterium]MDC0131409.1 cupin domain-containing protein [Alphaproteobacteria bacterium]MDC1241148.1 cupin domain-containing protein [bacterium]